MSPYRLKGTSGPVIDQAWNLEERTVIGSSGDCDINIESEAMAPQHAELQVREGSITLKLLEDDGELYLNGQAVEESPLLSGDEIRIGNCRFMLQAPGLKPERVLTEEAVRRRRNFLPWLIAGGASGLALLAWKLGYLPF